MFIDTPLLDSILRNSAVATTFNLVFVILAILYFIFSLVVIGQVRMMTETIATEAGPLLRFFSIIHAGIALGVIVLFIAFF